MDCQRLQADPAKFRDALLTVVLGGSGAVVTRKVVPTGRGDVPLDAHWSLNYLVSRNRGVAPPTDLSNAWRRAR